MGGAGEHIQHPVNGSRHILSVDVEDWFQVWALSEVIRRDSWDGFSLRVEDNTRRLLDLFDENGAKATFFTLGWVAERCPGLIREIVARGHELASHGYDHTKVFDQTPDVFRADVKKTKAILEEAGGTGVNGFRAAGFSIDQRTPWAHEILAETGHSYSSSLHPIAHDHYNMPDAPRFAYQPLKGSDFREIPVSTVDVAGKRFSCAGGGWFRLLPAAWTDYLLGKLIREENAQAVFYLHPWEIDPGQPRITGLSIKSRLRHYTNLGRMEGKLTRLLTKYDWDSFAGQIAAETLENAA